MAETDPLSYSNAHEVRVRHLDLDLDVLFDRRVLKGSVVLEIERLRPDAGRLVLDTRAIDVEKVEAAGETKTFSAARFEIGATDPILGAPLRIELAPDATRVRVFYSTRPEASALQWLAPSQTAGGKLPFLFTQSQAIHARSWIPLQDTPGVRQTYAATIRTPPDLAAVWSAANGPGTPRRGESRVRMPEAIPSYLIALAVGDLGFESIGRRTGVYAEPSVTASAAREFSDTERMMEAAERLFGPYRWERYDLLVLPPSFPYGGMENPRLTFATPTLLAGDRSLVDVVAHELAHSWSGNLVTNATWSDFWLNEGVTTYCERRIVEVVFGSERADMDWVLGRQDLEESLARHPDADEILHIDLKGRNPDDALTSIAYEKGALFLRALEEAYGREWMDSFLRGYFDRFAFRSLTTPEFERYLAANAPRTSAGSVRAVAVREWLYEPGVPRGAPVPRSAAFDRVDRAEQEWRAGRRTAAGLDAKSWTTQEWLRFLRRTPEDAPAALLAELDAAFGFSRSGNSEITFQWLRMAIRSGYEAAMPRLETFLTEMGRRKFVKPLFEELVKTPAGKARAVEIYRKARSGYHPIVVDAVEKILEGRA